LICVTSNFNPRKLLFNGAGGLAIGGPKGDGALSGKKLVIDHHGHLVPIGGCSVTGKDPHKIGKCGTLRVRQLAKQLVQGDSGCGNLSRSLGRPVLSWI
jgi:S-adenosylmethionine synthetase